MNSVINSNITSFSPIGFEFNITKKKALQEEGTMFLFVFFGIFALMMLVILVLVCKICALRRAIVPDMQGIEFGERGRALTLRLPAFNKE
ncbi:hypothetical protein PRIPAC_97801 [Pristionchus pacificus]|uniref:Uncharacterized protein n=1 Tax=Pristionchus pacificus TaxID=54126 RepID=A0A2A6D1V9_PRIPA|nr:hypothetical protein PRIPAC_97801 [Pristionchus pacificus]|eukprot:PDM84368.1 hypothetical protein PRIPAC_33391 [Pristionchus pacificus]